MICPRCWAADLEWKEIAGTGTLYTGRDAVHKYLHEGGKLPAGVDFKNGVLYHCGPVVIKDEAGAWKCVAAGPTTSMVDISLRRGSNGSPWSERICRAA